MNNLEQVDLLRRKANAELNPKNKVLLGQFFTPSSICLYMASLFTHIKDEVCLLDPGSGIGSLSLAFVEEAIRRKQTKHIKIHAYDIEPKTQPFINNTFSLCLTAAQSAHIACHAEFKLEDFILNSSFNSGLFNNQCYTHVIMNPPYKKIATNSQYRKVLSAAGIETVNLYAGFIVLALQKLKSGGELVAIVPRSFCNGPYYQAFRRYLLNEAAIQHIHLFGSRYHAFADDEVLQENIIIHLIKGITQDKVTISTSPVTDFYLDEASGTVTASDMTMRTVAFENLVYPDDTQQFIHIAANESDQQIINTLSIFTAALPEIGVEVSTGPVVDFRLKGDLREHLEAETVPLLYPIHLDNTVNWPKKSKKPNAISISQKSKTWLWQHSGYFVIIRRFSSKEEKRRVIATLYDSSLPGKLIGFDNKLNIFHCNKTGMDEFLAKGLYVYLNCTLLDKYYRIFGGHTQVNATDLRNIRYPDIESLRRIGQQVQHMYLTQVEIDTLIEQEITLMTGQHNDPLAADQKITQALEIIKLLGLPKAQQNERSALTLLALLNLSPNDRWQTITRPLLGVTPIMEWCREHYGKAYAPNTRETFRRQTLHQFVAGGLCLYNPDEPDRAVNSPKACYQMTADLFDVLLKYGSEQWEDAVSEWLKHHQTLVAQYALEREMVMIPLTLSDGTTLKLSAGSHSQLIHDIITEFAPRFVPGAEVLYLGDTSGKETFFEKARFIELGITLDEKGKLPDVILYWPTQNWLLLIESVTSHGPVDGKRYQELATIFSEVTAHLVYVTAFPDRKTMTKYLADIAWETEVWVADAPTHMIHFDGDKFLRP